MNEYPVVLITDNNYCIPTGVAIQSLIDSYKKDAKLIVYIIACNVDDENKALFNALSTRNAEVKIIECNLSELKKYSEINYYVSPSALLKFLIPNLISEYERILYIDGDVLVRKDITDIFETDIDGYYAAAVADFAGMFAYKFHTRLKLPRYFNTGVLLLNAKRLRAEHMDEKLFACKAAHPEYQCMDQDVFNVVFKNEVKFLPHKYNVMMANLEIMQKEMGITMREIDTFFHSDYGSYKNLEADSYLLHLTNEFKPWIYKNVYMHEEWLKIFKRTPFAKKELEFKTKRKDADIQKHTWHRIPFIERVNVKNQTKIRVFGIPLAKRVWTDYEIITTLFFVFKFIKPNWNSIYFRFNSYLSAIRNVQNTLSENIREKAVLSQISRLSDTTKRGNEI